MIWGKIKDFIVAWWIVALVIAGGVGLAFIPLTLGADSAPDAETATRLKWLLALSVACAGIGPIADRIRSARRESKVVGAAEEKLAEARADLTLAIVETIPPNLAGVIDALELKSIGEDPMRQQITNVLHHCKAFLTTDGVDVRANYYRLEGEGKKAKLTRWDMTGGDSRHEFTQSSRDHEGRVVVPGIQQRQVLFCSDVKDPDQIARFNLDTERERPYEAFLSVPVATGEKVFGMLSVNALKRDILDEEHDGGILKVMAWLIVIAETLHRLPANWGRVEESV